ncbi:MAG: hypothetical protein KAX49_18255 [Halanaerobiales bacterium]|nr:hypothetical protein [Halanaerobiales bacterium]
MNGESKYSGIDNYDDLRRNLAQNCIPESIFNMDIKDYDEFLEQRRRLIAEKIYSL